MKQKVILKTSDHPWFRVISSFPKDAENIKIFYRDKVAEEASDVTAVLLSVRKPEFLKCPDLDKSLKEWLTEGWDYYGNEVGVLEKIERPQLQNELSASSHEKSQSDNEPIEPVIDKFTDNAARVKAYKIWKARRDTWVAKQLIYKATRGFFRIFWRFIWNLNVNRIHWN